MPLTAFQATPRHAVPREVCLDSPKIHSFLRAGFPRYATPQKATRRWQGLFVHTSGLRVVSDGRAWRRVGHVDLLPTRHQTLSVIIVLRTIVDVLKEKFTKF
jgi:hypothetical protein